MYTTQNRTEDDFNWSVVYSLKNHVPLMSPHSASLNLRVHSAYTALCLIWHFVNGCC